MNANTLLKKIMLELKKREVKFAQATLDNGTVIESETFEAGSEVFIVTEDERIALPVGEYTLEDGEILVVEQEGIIASVAKPEMAQEEEIPAGTDENVETDMETEVEVETPAELAPKVEEIVQAVIEVVAPLFEELKKEIDMMKESMDYKKQEMSAKPAAKPIKHAPVAEKPSQVTKLSKNGQPTLTSRIFERMAGK